MNISIAYISNEIIDFLKTHFEPSHVHALLQHLAIAEFDYQSSLNPKFTAELIAKSRAKDDALLLLSKYIGYDTWQDTEIEINVLFKDIFADFWKNDDNIIAQNLFNVLHLIEPRLNAISAASSYQESWEKLGNRFEEDFIHKDLSSAAGDMWIQLFEQQRSFENIPEKHQKVDYVVEFPYLLNDKKGLWIEVDGEIHETEAQKIIDNQRNNYAIFNQWLPVWRIKTEDFNLIHRQIAPLQQLLQHDYFRRLAQNYRHALTNTDLGLDALQVLLSPVAIARIHKALITCLLDGYLTLEHRIWRIAILEQDVPCGYLAIEFFKNLCHKVFELEGENRSLPDIQVTIITTRKYEYARLNKNIPKQFISEYIEKEPTQNSKQPFDVLIDMSVLQRKGWNLVGNYHIVANTKIIIRSSFRANSFVTEIENYSQKKTQNTLQNEIQNNVLDITNLINLANFSNLFANENFINKNFTNNYENNLIANLLEISKINTTIFQNYFVEEIEISPKNIDKNTSLISIFKQQYKNLFENSFENHVIIPNQLFLQLSNTALLLQLELLQTQSHDSSSNQNDNQNYKQPLYKLWAAFALLVQVGNSTEFQVEKLLNLAEKQLFESFYELKLADFEVFDKFYKDFSAKIIHYIQPQNQSKIASILQNSYYQIEILPHITWLKGFKELVYAD